MAQRLSVIRMQPSVVLEWGALAGQSRGVLEAAYPNARWTPVGPTGPAERRQPPPPASQASLRERLVPLRTWAQGLFQGAAKEAAALGFAEDEVPASHGQLLWSNLGLHTHGPAAQVLRRWHAALAVDGFLMFSTFGPDTLRELRGLWAEAGWGPPAQSFRDMHDWGDDLVAAGFADPVMDQETLTLTWTTAEAALAELRTLGRNAHPGRHPGCRTPRWRSRLRAALQGHAGPDGRLALSFEIIYGHAFRPTPRRRLQPTTTVSLEDMRHMVKTARRSV
jgi:malonyl-CoA O-methyltransferase